MAECPAEYSQAATCENKVFNDPIHGHIELHPLCVKIIDTPQFQRLRYIKQLGGCYYVYPGASHNRFEHCIGVCHLAGQLIRAIKQRQPELGITEQDVLCVQIAGLCHDLGHGPFSHMFEDFLHKMRPGHKWKHEQASVQIFEHLLLKNNLQLAFMQYGLVEQDITFIKEQIAGPLEKGISKQNWPYHGRHEQKSFLYEVVANKRNGIDVDKWDYFARDCYHLGVKSSFDHHRFISFCRVIRADGEMQICNRDKEVSNTYDMFYVRSILHRRAYKHKTTKVIEIMITEALEKADNYLLTEGRDGKHYRISECIDDVEAFLKLTDTIYHRILYSSDPRLSEARDVLDKIESRKLYKYVGQTKPNKASADVFTKHDSATIREEIASFSLKDNSGKPYVKPDDITVVAVKIDYGKDEENPIDSFRFYTKNNPDMAIEIKQEEVSLMLPKIYGYKYMLVYSRKLDTETIQHVSLCFREWCKKNDMTRPENVGVDED